jgi:uncharacterized delta-60 repeat protein
LLTLLPAVLVASLILVSGAQAAAGDLDPTFSGDGKQTSDFGGCCGAEGAAAVAIQADGKLVAAGTNDFEFDFALARYNSDGTLDTSFSGDGRRTNFADFDGASGVALQGDGRIVAAGVGNGDFALARYLGG